MRESRCRYKEKIAGWSESYLTLGEEIALLCQVIPRLCPFVFLVRVVCKWRQFWVWRHEELRFACGCTLVDWQLKRNKHSLTLSAASLIMSTEMKMCIHETIYILSFLVNFCFSSYRIMLKSRFTVSLEWRVNINCFIILSVKVMLTTKEFVA